MAGANVNDTGPKPRPRTTYSEMSRRFTLKLWETPKRYEEIKRKLAGQKTPFEMFSTMWNLHEAHAVMTPSLIYSGKCPKMASVLENEANTYYVKRCYIKALELYNKSIMFAPHPVLSDAAINSEDSTSRDDPYVSSPINPERYGGNQAEDPEILTRLYSNRSIVLKDLQLFDYGLSDVDFAVKYDVLGTFKTTLQKIRLDILTAREFYIGKKPKEPVSKRSRTALKDPHGIEEMKGLGEILNSLKVSKEREEPPSLEFLMSRAAMEPPKIEDPSHYIPAFSNSLRVFYHDSKGRFVVAVRDIRPGEVLGIEEAISVDMESTSQREFCSNCLRFAISPLPCPACCQVIFCSESCRAQYLAEDHWLECKILGSLVDLKLGAMNVIVKMVKNFTYEQIRHILQEMSEVKPGNPARRGFDSKGMFLSKSFHAIDNICGDNTLMSLELIFSHCQMAFVVTKLIQQSKSFFVDSSGQPIVPTEMDLMVTGALLLSSFSKVYFNQLDIVDVQTDTKLGSGIFPTMSLLNHSCVPSAKVYTLGRQIILRSLVPISAGEEVHISYVEDFDKIPFGVRKYDLEKYKFKCSCEACIYCWPVYANLPVLPLKAGEASAVMKVNAQALLKTISRVYQIITVMKSSQEISRKDFEVIVRAVERLHTHVRRDSQNFVDILDGLFRSFLYGM